MGGFAPGTVEPRSRSRTQPQPCPATRCHTNIQPGTLGPMGNSIPPAVLGRPVSDAETHRDRGHVLRASPPRPSARQAHAGALVGGSVGTGLWGWPPGAPGPAGPTRVGASHVGGSGPARDEGEAAHPPAAPWRGSVGRRPRGQTHLQHLLRVSHSAEPAQQTARRGGPAPCAHAPGGTRRTPDTPQLLVTAQRVPAESHFTLWSAGLRGAGGRGAAFRCT